MAKKTNARVDVPRNVQDLLELANKVYAKHLVDGASSPLNALVDEKWEVEGPKIANCLAKHLEAEDLKRKMEMAYKERDIDFEGISNIVGSSSGLLKNVYSKNAKKLGEWGFNTVETSYSPRKKSNTPTDGTAS
jgi:hypothetical protein